MRRCAVFYSVGFPLEDCSALRCVRRLALELGVEQDVTLVSQADDLKDLFRHTQLKPGRVTLRRVA